MGTITPTLWFEAGAADAVERYTDGFDDARITGTTRYDRVSAAPSDRTEGDLLTLEFELEGQRFTALDGGATAAFTPAISFIVACPTIEEVDELWDLLSRNGTELMALDSYPFSDRYGWTNDEFGVSWQVIHDSGATERTITPSLLFVGDRCGQAETAIEYYTSTFDDSGVATIERYGPNQAPDEEGTVMYADFRLAGQQFAAMDSARDHEFGFNESVSFVVDCDDQDEIDHFWEELTANGGEPGNCGWLTDRFGVSWQIVPSVLSEFLKDEEPERTERVMESVLEMQKIDIGALRNAYDG